jgi:hypothetical protein
MMGWETLNPMATPMTNSTARKETGVRTVLLAKNDMLGIFGISPHRGQILVASTDTRLTEPSKHLYDSREIAQAVFNDRLQATLANGWGIFYDGPPLRG